MEFPDLGKNCSVSTCKRLDFLPMKCDACRVILCSDHIMYEQHSCPEAYKKDNQVPVCPLCNKPIPVKPGATPDAEVGRHIDTDCQSDPAKEKRGKVYSNKCSKKGCKTKELVPFNCGNCQKNYCIRHRNELDHDCKGFEDTGRSGTRAGAAALARFETNKTSSAASKPKPKPQQTKMSDMGRELDRQRQERQNRAPGSNMQNLQGNMSEDEAMARALAMSMSDPQPKPQQQQQAPASPEEEARRRQQEEEDAALARALAESERDANRPPQRAFQIFA